MHGPVWVHLCVRRVESSGVEYALGKQIARAVWIVFSSLFLHLEYRGIAHSQCANKD